MLDARPGRRAMSPNAQALSPRIAFGALLAGLGVEALYHGWQWRRDREFLASALRSQGAPASAITITPAPRISILVAAWNESEGIERHIQSVLSLSYPNLEYILCAGGRDGTYAVAARHQGAGFIVLEQQPSEGKQRSLARCLQQATGSLIYLTDADCILSPQAFERVMAPLLDGSEQVVTGFSRAANPSESDLVAHQWSADLYNQRHMGRYVEGLLGRNCAMTREALERAGGFDEHVPTGTDYYLAKRLLAGGYRIRHVAESVVTTPYPVSWLTYRQQRSRWMRNMVYLGLRFKAYQDVRGVVGSALLGSAMVLFPALALLLGPIALVPWLLALSHGSASRIRYLAFAGEISGFSWPVRTYALAPFAVLTDCAVWATAIVDYLVPGRRIRW